MKTDRLMLLLQRMQLERGTLKLGRLYLEVVTIALNSCLRDLVCFVGIASSSNRQPRLEILVFPNQKPP